MWKRIRHTLSRVRRCPCEETPTRLSPTYQLLRGEFKPSSLHSTLLFFTVHKAASSFAGKLLHEIATSSGIIPVDLDGYMHENTPSPEDGPLRPLLEDRYFRKLEAGAAPADAEVTAALRTVIKPQGCLYAPLRNPWLLQDVPELDRFRVILLLRDPRDCLTSLYYSLAYSHRPPENRERRDQFQARRNQIREMDLDQSVLRFAPPWQARYAVYCEMLRRHENVHLLKYEQLVTDFPAWLRRVEAIWGLEIQPAVRRRILAEADFSVPKEDVFSHKRQVQPGDHRRKLRPETIARLNDLLGSVLEPLGYRLAADDSQAA